MGNDRTKALGRVIRVDEGRTRGHLNVLVRGTVEETLNGLPDAEADENFRARSYQHLPDLVATLEAD